MSGAFQTSRELFDNPIWKNIVEFRLFFLIYGRAVFSEDGVRLADDLILKRGEWCRSTRKLQEDLQYIENRQVKTYSTSVINRCIKRLEKSQRICTRIHELGTVFTVVNYEQYQGFDGYKKTNLEQDLEQSGNSRGTVEEQSGNNNKKENKDNKVKKDKKKDIIPKINFAEFVSMTQEEYDKLLEAHGQDKLNRIIEALDNYKGANNKKYASDYRAILTWVVNRVEDDERKLTVIPGGGNGGKYQAGYAGPSEASRKAASRGAETFIGSPGRESGLTTEEVQRRASNFE
jgi:hypothetical protein